MKLNRNAFDLALNFVEAMGRPLEAARIKYHFQDGPVENVVASLQSFQNEDGGFGNAIEPDLRAPESSALGTSIAFQIMRECDGNGFGNIPAKAVEYLLSIFDKSKGMWRIISQSADSSPHAPWWNQKGREDVFDSFSLNPTAEILGYLYDNLDQTPTDVLSQVTDRVVSHLSGIERIEMHELLCCLRLLHTRALPEDIRDRIRKRLKDLTAGTITCDPTQWKGYNLRPLQVVDRPESPFMAGLEEAVAGNLDYEIESQNDDGSWTPTWTWVDAFPDIWKVACREWSGIITLEKLLILKRFDRISGLV
ncbi:MAG: hypothetical protein P8Y80_13610 [Acidobacteriota bacterium]|jgi:hypothetical protein